MKISLKNSLVVFGLISGLQAMEQEEMKSSEISSDSKMITNNPVLDGELIYNDPLDRQKKEFRYKIRDLVDHTGKIELTKLCKDTNIELFKSIDEILIMTTSIEEFLAYDKAYRFVILIAPWSIINEKLETTAYPFKEIMAKWDGNKAPIGMFWRKGEDKGLKWCHYLINQDLKTISENNLCQLGCKPNFMTGGGQTFGYFYSMVQPYRLQF